MERIPQIMVGANVVIEGVGFLGVAKEIELPKIEFTTITSSSGLGEREIDTGLLKAMSTKIVLNEYNDVYFKALRSRLGQNAKLYAKQSIARNEDKKEITATFRGSVKVMELPKYEHGKEVEVSLEIALDFFKFEYDKTPYFLYDQKNMVLEIDGVDQYEEIRNQLI
jgi:P2 family phage contractile tail tube protein